MMGKSFKMLINRGFDPIGGGGHSELSIRISDLQTK